MPPNFIRVMVDLEGVVRDYHTKNIKNAQAIGKSVNVEVDVRELSSVPEDRKEEYDARVDAAVERGRDKAPNATAYSVGDERRSYAQGYVYVPIQFYRWKKD